jgi:hypothetical protein
LQIFQCARVIGDAVVAEFVQDAAKEFVLRHADPPITCGSIGSGGVLSM